MQKETIRLLVNYNKSVNRKMNEIIKTLDQAEWEKSLGGFFPSVRSLCSHLYIGDFNWLKRFRALRTFTTLSDPFFDRELSFNETIFPDKNEYLEKRPDLDDRFIAFGCVQAFGNGLNCRIRRLPQYHVAGQFGVDSG